MVEPRYFLFGALVASAFQGFISTPTFADDEPWSPPRFVQSPLVVEEEASVTFVVRSSFFEEMMARLNRLEVEIAAYAFSIADSQRQLDQWMSVEGGQCPSPFRPLDP